MGRSLPPDIERHRKVQRLISPDPDQIMGALHAAPLKFRKSTRKPKPEPEPEREKIWHVRRRDYIYVSRDARGWFIKAPPDVKEREQRMKKRS